MPRLWLSDSPPYNPSPMSFFFNSPPTYDCIVVGAGVSGLKTARDLVSKHGVSLSRLLILEAQDYVGGRIRQNTDFIPGVKVELGAEILHGQNTELTRFAEEQNEPIEEIYCWAHGDGGPLDEPIHNGYGLYFVGNKWQSEKTSRTRLLRYDEEDDEFQRLNQTLWSLSEMHEDNVDPNLSLKDHLLALGFGEAMVEMAAAGFANTLCANIHELSLKQSVRWTRLWFQDADGDYKFKNSYSCLIDFLKKGLDIRLNKPVSRVDYKDKSKMVQITTTDGSVYCARTAVFAISPHAIGSGFIRFNPPLPSRKVEALSFTKMNRALKVFVKFSQLCWPEHLMGTITANTETSFPEIWFRDCRELTSDRSQGVCYATAFVTSHYADRLCDLPEEQIFAKMTEQLDLMFSHLEPRHCVPTLDGREEEMGSVDLPKPSSVFLGGLIKRWTAEDHPFIGGGYCSPLVGCPINSGDLIAEPVENLLFFAGEAANLGPGATAHAALETGVRAARQVTEALREGRMQSRL